MARRTREAKVAADLDAHNAKLAEALEAHDRLDTERFDKVTTTLTEISTDVKSLLQTRSFTRGVWRAAFTGGGIVAFATTVGFEIIKLVRGH